MKKINTLNILCALLLVFSYNNNVQAVPTVPDAPTFTGGTTIGETWVKIFWNAPNDGGSPITGYQVFASNSSSSGYVLAGQPTVLTWNVTGLTNSVTYYFKITAFNAIGVGINSTIISAIPATIPGSPSATVAIPGDTHVLLTWNAPNDGGSSITGYQVFVSDNSILGYVLAAQPTAVTWNVTGLTNGVTSYFKIAAFNAIGVGPNSTIISATPVTVPGTPSATIATPGDSHVLLTWNAPYDGGSLIIGYQLFVSNSSSSGYVLAAQPTALKWNVTGLTNGVTYYFKIAAFNAIGVGFNSTEISTTLPSFTTPSASTSSSVTSPSTTKSVTTDNTVSDDTQDTNPIGFDSITLVMGFFVTLTVIMTIKSRRSI